MTRTRGEIKKLQKYIKRIFPYYYKSNVSEEGIRSIVNAIPKNFRNTKRIKD